MVLAKQLILFASIVFLFLGFEASANEEKFAVKVKVELFDNDVYQEMRARYSDLNQLTLEEYEARRQRKDSELQLAQQDFLNFIKSAPLEILDYEFPKNEGGYKGQKDFDPSARKGDQLNNFPLFEQFAMERLALLLIQTGSPNVKSEFKRLLSFLAIVCPDHSSHPVGIAWNNNTAILASIFTYYRMVGDDERLFALVPFPTEENDGKLIAFLMRRFSPGAWNFHHTFYSGASYRSWGKAYYSANAEMSLPYWKPGADNEGAEWYVVAFTYDSKLLKEGKFPLNAYQLEMKNKAFVHSYLPLLPIKFADWLKTIGSNL